MNENNSVTEQELSDAREACRDAQREYRRLDTKFTLQSETLLLASNLHGLRCRHDDCGWWSSDWESPNQERVIYRGMAEKVLESCSYSEVVKVLDVLRDQNFFFSFATTTLN